MVFFPVTDVDECASPETKDCHSNALCTNSEGSYVCRCLKGFTGDGKSCTGKSPVKSKAFYFPQTVPCQQP